MLNVPLPHMAAVETIAVALLEKEASSWYEVRNASVSAIGAARWAAKQ
jgi:hypothetical protein